MQPNVIVLLLDAARADHLSCYGYERETTPFLDSLARESTVYENAYSNSIWSLPAYASVFTGKYPSEHGAVDWQQRIASNTLVEGLNDAGYRTHVVSPHVVSGAYNIQQSFDTQEWIDALWLDFDDPIADRIQERNNAGGWESDFEKYRDVVRWVLTERSYQTVPNAVRYLYERAKQSRGHWRDNGGAAVLTQARERIDRSDEPFFLFANFIEPHSPYRPPRDYIRTFVDDDVTIEEMNRAIDISSVATTMGTVEITDRQRRILLDLYDAELSYLDRQLAVFYEHLDRSGLLDDTILAVFSDHGDLFGEWNVWEHQARIHNDLCRVPLLVRYPDREGRREPDVVELRALHDYVLEVATGEYDTVPLLETTDEAIVEYHGWGTQHLSRPWEDQQDVSIDFATCYQASIISDGYRLLWDSNGAVELYDLESDPDERTNLAERSPSRVDELQRRIEQAIGTPNVNRREYQRASDDSIDAEVRRRLEELGYA